LINDSFHGEFLLFWKKKIGGKCGILSKKIVSFVELKTEPKKLKKN
jgi:hypothetical protein